MIANPRPLDRRFVGWWGLSLALGWAVTGLGPLPNLTFLDFTGIDAGGYAHLETVYGAGLLAAAGGGVLSGAIQARVLQLYGWPGGRRWLLWTALAWTLAWALCGFGLLSALQFRDPAYFLQNNPFAKISLLPVVAIVAAGCAGAFQQRYLHENHATRPGWYQGNLFAWAVALVTYWGLHRLDDWRLLPGRLIPALLAGAVLGLVAGAGWRRLLQRAPAPLAGGPRAWAWPAGLTLAALAVLTIPEAFCFTRGCPDPWPAGEPPPWPAQLAVARAAAARLDPRAVPDVIIANPPEFRNWNGDFRTLDVQFNFYDPAGGGSAVDVGFLDTAPALTVTSRRSGGESVASAVLAPPDQVWRALAAMRISPADVLRRTLPEMQAFARQHPGLMSANIGLSLLGRSGSGGDIPPLRWTVSYLLDSTPRRIASFIVDAQTGTVLSREVH